MKRFSLIFLLVCMTSAQASRLKDIASLKGVRSNQLFGYGLVIGLAGTGDKNLDLTDTSLQMALKGLGADIKDKKIESKNVASVVVSATLPAFTKMGSQLDATISSIGSASSLEGGTLLMTSLRGADGNIYAMAQGKVLALKKMGEKGGGSSQNVVTAMIPSGVTLEKEVAVELSLQKELRYQLNHPDFTTAARVAKKLNEELGGKYATAVDAGVVSIIPPYTYDGSAVDLIAQLENVDVEQDRRAKVVINARTGTVVLGDQVKIAPVAIAHNNLKIEIREAGRAVASGGSAASGASSDASGKPRKVLLLNQGATVADIVASLNEMGASGDDLVALLNSLKASGAMVADLEMQ